jgi:hypothetical protein
VIHLALNLVRYAGLSLRGTAATLAVYAATNDPQSLSATPCATTVRSWILRLGYAQLTRPLPHSHSWAWLIDHTLQIGSTKLFTVVGVPLDQVPFGVRPLTLADLHLVAMVPMEESNQQRVAQALADAVPRTGAPRQIVADGGSDLQKGIALFQKDSPRTVSVPDIAHSTANLLKYYWENDPRWSEFTRRMSETAAKLRQTTAAHLMAPKLRNKARFMSVGSMVKFGRVVLRKLKEAQPDSKVVQWYSWLLEYEVSLAGWAAQHAVAQVALKQVRLEGLFERGEAELEAEWERLELIGNPASLPLQNRLRAYVGRYGRQLRGGERLIGSTEILESAFGVLKRLSRDQSQSGLTMLSVGLGAMLGQITPEQIQEDLDRVPEKNVESWGKRMIGKTVQWLRRQFFQTPSATQTPSTPQTPEPVSG